MIHRIKRGLEPRGRNRNRRQRHKHVFHVKQSLHTSLLHHSHHRQQKQRHAPPAQPPKSRFEPVTALALFHVKHSAPVPTGARTRKRATTHQPRTNDHRQQAGCHPSAAPRSITHAHLHRAHSRRAAHAQRPTPAALHPPPAAPHAHTRSARRDLPPQSPAPPYARRSASPPPLAQAPREDPMPRREDPGEHEARGEHQDDRGARGHVQGPREVQADEAPGGTQHG